MIALAWYWPELSGKALHFGRRAKGKGDFVGRRDRAESSSQCHGPVLDGPRTNTITFILDFLFGSRITVVWTDF